MTTALEWGADVYEIFRYEIGLTEEETQELMNELYGES